MRQVMQRKKWLRGLTVFIFAGAGILLALGLTHRATADYELPPRTAPAVDVVTSIGAQNGGRVHLRGHFSDNWPWDELHWQSDVWHVVQWRDADGVWYDVTGWQGTFDAIQQEVDWVGQKELWAAKERLGSGPYRWQVYQGQNGRLLAISDSFHLPTQSGDLVIVNLDLTP